MIVDVHAHLGWDPVFEFHYTQEDLLASQEQNAIDVTIVQPASCHRLEDVREQHDAIARLCSTYPGRFYGMANPNPHLNEAEYRGELLRCVNELGFVGVKIHPAAHALNPNSGDGRRVAEAARELQIPLMIHTGSGIPWALPTNISPLAKDYPDVRIVMAHSGMMLFAGDALAVAQAHPNVYLETTWTPGFQVKRFVETLGASRVLFASDHADNAATEIVKVKTARLNDADTAMVLGGTAAAVYRLPELR